VTLDELAEALEALPAGGDVMDLLVGRPDVAAGLLEHADVIFDDPERAATVFDLYQAQLGVLANGGGTVRVEVVDDDGVAVYEAELAAP
jgi:hypothetical protein